MDLIKSEIEDEQKRRNSLKMKEEEIEEDIEEIIEKQEEHEHQEVNYMRTREKKYNYERLAGYYAEDDDYF